MTTLKMAAWFGRGTVLAQVMEDWAAKIARLSDGKHEIDIFYAGELVSAFDVNDAVASGVADLGVQYHTSSALPGTEAAAFPFLAPADGNSAANLFRSLPSAPFDLQLQTLLGATHGEPLVLVLAQAPGADGPDLDGMKIVSSGAAAKLVQSLGGVNVALPFAELFTALQVGVVDGALVPASVAAGFKLSEAAGAVLTFQGDVSPGSPASLLTINADTLDALPADLAALIAKTTGAGLSRKMGEAIQESYYAAVESIGEFSDWTGAAADEFRTAAEDYIDQQISSLGKPASNLFAKLLQLFEIGTPGRDIMAGADGADILVGLGGRDLIRAGKGDDVLDGGGGKDRLIGGGGKDELDGGRGNDLLIGGRGADVFVFSGRFGNDRIRDFDAGSGAEDIDLSGVKQIRNWQDLRDNHLEQAGGDAVITAGGNTIILLDVSVGDLDKSDFLF